MSIEFEAISLPRALYAAVAETPRLQGVWLVGCVCGEFYEDAARATRQLVENLTAAGFEPDVLREVKGAAADFQIANAHLHLSLFPLYWEDLPAVRGVETPYPVQSTYGDVSVLDGKSLRIANIALAALLHKLKQDEGSDEFVVAEVEALRTFYTDAISREDIVLQGLV